MESAERQELFDAFDVKDYLRLKVTDQRLREGMEYLSQWMHSVFSTGKIKGDKLLDVGTGPIVNSVMYAEPYFNSIYLSDFSKNNLLFLEQWRKGDQTELLRPYFERAVKMEGNGQTPEEKEDKLKSKIKDVFYCDVIQSNPLCCNKEYIGQFDVVTISWTLSTAAYDVEEYKQALTNVISLIRPGGYIVLMDITCTAKHYYINNIPYPASGLRDFEIIKIVESVCNETSFLSTQSFCCEDDEDVYYLVNIVGKV